MPTVADSTATDATVAPAAQPVAWKDLKAEYDNANIPLPQQRQAFQRWSADALNFARGSANKSDYPAIHDYIANQYANFDKPESISAGDVAGGVIQGVASTALSGTGIADFGMHALGIPGTGGPAQVAQAKTAQLGQGLLERLGKNPDVIAGIIDTVRGKKTEDQQSLDFQLYRLQKRVADNQPLDEKWLSGWSKAVKDQAAETHQEDRGLYDQPDRDVFSPENLNLLAHYKASLDPQYLKALSNNLAQSATIKQAQENIQNSNVAEIGKTFPNLSGAIEGGLDPTTLPMLAVGLPEGEAATALSKAGIAKGIGGSALKLGALSAAQSAVIGGLENPDQTPEQRQKSALLAFLSGAATGGLVKGAGIAAESLKTPVEPPVTTGQVKAPTTPANPVVEAPSTVETPPTPEATPIPAVVEQGKAATGGGKAGEQPIPAQSVPHGTIPPPQTDLIAQATHPDVEIADIAAQPGLEKIPVAKKADLQVQTAISRPNNIFDEPKVIISAGEKSALMTPEEHARIAKEVVGLPVERGVYLDNPKIKDVQQAVHANMIETAMLDISGNKPVSAKAVDAYGLTPPEGYVREGDLYVYKPEQQHASSVRATDSGSLIDSDGSEIKPGEGIKLSFAGGPSDLPEPWTLVKAENYHSSVNNKLNPRVTIEAADGSRRAFGNANIYSPRKPVTKEAPAVFIGNQEGLGPLYNLTEDIPSHPKGSTLSGKTLEGLGYELPSNQPTVDTSVAGGRVVELPIKNLKLSEDVPQFKSGANDKGIIEPLGGDFDRRGVGPIQVWERLNGDQEIISGRHRFDLAQRSGEETIPAQVYREADGFTKEQAQILDAELNIRDNQGSTADYASYFRKSGITPQDAEGRGLLARAKGKAGASIGFGGSEDTFSLHQAGKLGDAQAEAISAAAPNDANLQAVGIQAALDGKSADYSANLIKAAKSVVDQRKADGTQGDLFGFDDTAMKEMAAQAQRATEIQKGIRDQISAVSGAAKKPELAKKLGVNVKNPKAVQGKIAELSDELARWQNWPTDPELVAQVKGETTNSRLKQELPPTPPIAANLASGGELFNTSDAFNLSNGPEQDDPARLLREKESAIESAKIAEQQQTSIFDKPPTTQGGELNATTQIEQTEQGSPESGLPRTQARPAIPASTAEIRPSQSERPNGGDSSQVSGNVEQALRPAKDVLFSEPQIKVKAPKGATFARVTFEDPSLKPKAYPLNDLNGDNILQGQKIKKIEAGTIGADKTFKPMKGEVTVTPSGKGLVSGTSLEKWADKTINESKGRLTSGIDPELLAAYVVKGASFVEEGTRDFGAWSQKMLSEFGDKLKPHLQDIYDRATKHLEATSVLSQAWDNLTNKFKYGTSIPDYVATIHQAAHRAAEASHDEATRYASALNTLIGKDQGLRVKVGEALEGNDTAFGLLPEKLQEAVRLTRSAIDEKTYRITQQLKDVLPQELRDALGKNIGEYLARSYRIFDDPDAQRAAITPAQRNALIHDFMTQLGIGEAEAIHEYNQFIDRKNLSGVQNMINGTGKFAGKDVTAFIRRKDLLPSMRVVLGEYTDPVERAQKTLEKQNGILNNDVAQQAIRTQGLASGDLRLTEKPGDVEFQPQSDTGAKYDRLRGLYTDSAFRDKFFESDPFSQSRDLSAAGKVFHTVTALTNQALVALNPKTYVPQFSADLAANLMNGVVTPEGYAKGVREAARSVGLDNPDFITDPEAMKLRQEMIKEGVLGKSAGEGFLTPMTKKGSNVFDNLPGYRWASERGAKLFGGASNAAKVPRFLYEKGAYTDAYAKSLRAEHPEWTDAQVNERAYQQGVERAGEVMRGTSHYYENLPKGLKYAGKFIPTANYFISFPYNVYRTAWNTFAFAKQDLAEGLATKNQALTNIGLRRLAGLAAFATATGFGVKALNSGVSDAKRAALNRSFLPDYDKKEATAIQGDVDATHARYTPLSYLNPYTLVFKAVNDAATATGEEGVKGGLKSIGDTLAEQFGGDNPIFKAFGEAITNRDQYGRPITYPQDSVPAVKRAGYFVGHAMTPGILPYIDQVVKGAKGETSPAGNRYSLKDSLVSLGGIRTRDINPTAQFAFKARDVLNQLNTIQQGYRSEVKNNPAQADQLFTKAQAANQQAYQTLFNARDDLKTLGATDAQIATQLKNAGFSDLSIGQVMAGKSTPPSLPRPKEVLDAAQANNTILAVAQDAVQKADESTTLHTLAQNILANPTGENIRQQVMQGIKNGTVPSINGQPDPAFLQKLNTTYKTLKRDDGQTAQIKQLRQLGANGTDNARAREIYRIMNQDLETPEERLAFYGKLKDAGLLTPIVARQYQAISTSQPNAASAR